MRNLIVALFALGLMVGTAQLRAEEKKAESWTGILIDAKCGDGKTADKAAGHPKACAVKCAKGGSPIVFLTGDKSVKLDEASQKAALAFLEKEDSKTKVVVEGTLKEGTLTVTSIKNAEEKKG